MYDPCLVQQAQSIQQLLCEHPHKGRTETSELILLDELVQIDAQQLEHEAKMLLVYEGVF